MGEAVEMNALDEYDEYDSDASDATMLVDDPLDGSVGCGEHPFDTIGRYTPYTGGMELCISFDEAMSYYLDNINEVECSQVKLLTEQQRDGLIKYVYYGPLWRHKYRGIWAILFYIENEFDSSIQQQNYAFEIEDLHMRKQNKRWLPECFRDTYFNILWGAVSAKVIAVMHR